MKVCPSMASTNRQALVVVMTALMMCISAIPDLDYSDLEALGKVCTPRDSCRSPMNRSFYDGNCECDSSCKSHNDCCIDAPTYGRLAVPRIRGLVCLSQGPTIKQGVYTIGKCSKDWQGSVNIRIRCEYLNDNRDPLLGSPMTDIERNITYRNQYCAVCNHANVTDLHSWIVRVECDSLLSLNASANITEDYVQEYLVYKTTFPHRNKWGVYVVNDDGLSEEFYPCRINYKLPDYLVENVRYCRHSLISACAPTWRRDVIRQKCETYMAVVETESRAYKNPHCALCNYVPLADIMCPQVVVSRRKPPMSFTLLLDVNLSDGETVGEVSLCPTGEKYDPFFKRCRKLVCALPGHKLQNGKCAPGR